MEKRGKVQQKISCVFETEILNEPTKKRQFQGFRVVASDVLKDAALACDITNSVATEKLDGTCVYIAEFEGNVGLDVSPRTCNQMTVAAVRIKSFDYRRRGGGASLHGSQF